MSWGVLLYGKPGDALNAEVERQFSSAASNYKGQQEEQDVLAGKARVQVLLAAFPSDASHFNAVMIDAGGSRSNMQLELRVRVTPIRFIQ